MKKKSITLGQVGMLLAAVMGISFYKAWKEPIERRNYIEASSKQEEKYRREIHERIKNEMNEKKTEKKPEKKKYPRALPGGGLDWTGVDNAPKK